MATVTTTVEIKSAGEMSKRLARKNSKDRLADALAQIWNVSLEGNAEKTQKMVESAMADAVWGY